MTYNNIGIDHTLDWNRIRKLFIIGLVGGCMTFVGDWLLGYGVCFIKVQYSFGIQTRLMAITVTTS